jgi:hypothetical protein
MILFLVRSEECGVRNKFKGIQETISRIQIYYSKTGHKKGGYLKEISEYLDQEEVFGINSSNLPLSFGLQAIEI